MPFRIPAATASDTGALAPLREPVFRMLWLTWMTANLTMWMNDVAAAWLMTSLTDSPVMVALVATASTLPVFVLGLGSGALADILDRRLYFASTQIWVSVNAMLLAAASLAGVLNAPLLLALTFSNGVGLAMRWPVFAAIVPEIVSKPHLPAALALNGVAMNLSRVVGPMLAGALLASLGSASVFVLNALLAAGASVVILRWRAPKHHSTLPGERFVGAVRVGVQHVWQSPRMRVVLLRVFLFFLQASGLMALLPLVAKHLHAGGPALYTGMLASVGCGAIFAALSFPRWRVHFGRDAFVRWGTIVHAASSCVVVLAPTPWLALPALAVIGMAWISTANTLTVAAQMALPNWVRARGMSIYQMALMGGSAAGAMLWGQVAGASSVLAAVVGAAGMGLVLLVLLRKWSVEGGEDEDHSPAPATRAEPGIDFEPDAGPIMVTVEYQIDPTRAADFAEVMRLTRRARLRQGVLSWGLFRDTAQVGRYLEYFVDESWTEHLRRLERFTAADEGLRERRLSFHTGPELPKVQRFLADRLGG